jgi:hydroxyethylthiazole kinase-like sugar kinase family protein
MSQPKTCMGYPVVECNDMFHLPESVTIEMGTLEEGAEMYRKAIIDFFAIPPEMLEDEKPR